MTRLVFGEDLPTQAKKLDLTECGWHPVCGHVRHYTLEAMLEGGYSPNLVYGLLPRTEARARLTDCDTCRTPSHPELGL